LTKAKKRGAPPKEARLCPMRNVEGMAMTRFTEDWLILLQKKLRAEKEEKGKRMEKPANQLLQRNGKTKEGEKSLELIGAFE